MNKVLSKSEYLMFLKHPALLWLKKYDKGKIPEPNVALQALFDAGKVFEKFAEQLFPKGVYLGFDGYDQYLELPNKTEKEIKNGSKTILQGRLEKNDITCIFDVLDKVGKDEYDLIEIKASTKAKPEHLLDLAFQKLVLEQAGVRIRKVKVVHVNNNYKKKGKIFPKDITSTTDVTQEVIGLEGFTKQNITKAFEVMRSDRIPNTSPRYAAPSALKEWLEVYKNVHGSWGPHHIFNITGANPMALGQLEDLNIENIKDIPDEFRLKPKQQWQVAAHKNGKQYIDKTKIKDFLKTIKYPLYFLDYETLCGVIPPFDGLRAYDQLPFQYSLHIQKTKNSKLIHKEYLHTKSTDPTPGLLKSLKKDIGNKGTVLVWSESFEKSCNDLMGTLQPSYAWFLKDVNSRIKDLMKPFINGWFVDKGFLGSASLKNVYPVLVDDAYSKLNIQEGATAQQIWMATFLEGENIDQRLQIEKDLLEYCRLDTMAMVKILEVLKKI